MNNKKMLIKVLMITYKRPGYLKLSLERLCSSAPENLKITIWDNGSDTTTREVIEKYRTHRCVEQVIFSENNEKLRKPTNWFWKNSLDADLLGKVDDDCLVPEDWCTILEKAHRDIPEAGVLGCWRFLPDDFNYEKAKKKIYKFGDHHIMRNCWIEGSGYLMKKEVIHKIGFLRERESFTEFCIRASTEGFVHGWYYPFLYQEHMDDPRTEHTGIRSENDFQRLVPLTARRFNIRTREQWIQRMMTSARNLQEYSIDPYDFIGIRAWTKRRIAKILGKEYFPKVK